MTHRNDLPPIDFAALSAALLERVTQLLELWLPGGHYAGHEYVCAGLGGGAGRSLSINTKTGQWADFAGDDKGNDLLSLYAAIHNLSQGKAAKQVAAETGLESVAGIVKTGNAPAAPVQNPRPAPAAKRVATYKEGWTPIAPVPPNVLGPNFSHHERKNPAHIATYRVGDNLYGYVVRFIGSDGRKITMPYVWASSSRDGSQKWVWRGWEEPRPLFYPGGQAPAGRTVVVVEGEIKGEVLQRVLDAVAAGVYCVVSWPNGSKSWRKADWSWLAGCAVLLWPDCDSKREKPTAQERKACVDDAALEALEAQKPYLPEADQPGMAAMIGIGTLLRESHGCTVSMLPIPAIGTKPDGWDARDAIEIDGWSGEDVLQFFGRAQTLQAQAPEKAKPKLKVVLGGKSADSDGPVSTGGGAGGGGNNGGVPWWLEPYWDPEKGRWAVSRKLVIAALEHDDDLRGVVAYNELTNSIQCRKAWPWPHAVVGEVKGVDSLLLGNYLTKKYKLPSIPKNALEEALQTVAHAERYHPIREWLASLEWDGKPRLDKWLMYVIGESPKTIHAQHAEYLMLVGRFWLLGMVNRVMEPGCKFDYCPVLEGVGGLRKSTLAKVLAGKPYFSDTPFEIGKGKEGQEQVNGVWVYELAELSTMSKSDINAIKAFISSEVDRYRVAYGATVESFPRQCVLVGTTNEDTYLRDRTGNRRWWPFPVRHQINTEWVERFREQLFAEAFARYLQGERYYPDAEQEQRLFKPMQDSRLIETAVESDLLRLLTRSAGDAGINAVVHVDSEFLTISQFVTALGIDAAKSTPGLEAQIRGWLKQKGWTHGKKRVNKTPTNGYFRPAQWPPQSVLLGLDQLELEPDSDGNAESGQVDPVVSEQPVHDAGAPASESMPFGDDWDVPF